MKKRWRKHGDGSGRVVSCLMICGLFLGAPRAFSQRNDHAEYKLKLAFLYNFAQFVEWPSDAFQFPNAPLTVCVVGENPFQGELEQSLRGRTAGNHPIQLKKLMPG